jgi:hypothetical protein
MIKVVKNIFLKKRIMIIKINQIIYQQHSFVCDYHAEDEKQIGVIPFDYLLIIYLKIRSSLFFRYYPVFGDSYKIQCPSRNDQIMTLLQLYQEITQRLTNIFIRDQNGQRACHGNDIRFQNHPNYHDLLLFHQYFNDDNGKGLGASYQTY